MAHFAQLDDNDIVLQVIVINNDILLNEDGTEDENRGIQFCKNLLGENTNWVQTSYNNNLRKRYAAIGFKYDRTADVFLTPKPFNSWILNSNTYEWEAPVPKPELTSEELVSATPFYYVWDEEALNWQKRS